MSAVAETGRARRQADRMLPYTFDLRFTASGETVVDVEALVRGVLGAEGWPAFLEPADEWELIATLLGDAVLLEGKYCPRAGIEARPWLFERLRWKAKDWRRVKRRHPVLGTLPGFEGDPDDGVAAANHDQQANRRAGLGDGSHGAPGEVAGDRGDPRQDDLGRLLESGDRALLREVEALGLSAPPGTRARSPQARARLVRLDRARRARVRELEQGRAVELVA